MHNLKGKGWCAFENLSAIKTIIQKVRNIMRITWTTYENKRREIVLKGISKKTSKKKMVSMTDPKCGFFERENT